MICSARIFKPMPASRKAMSYAFYAGICSSLVVVAASWTAAAGAATIGPITDSVPSTSANWTTTLNFPKFNPIDGTLAKVSFALAGDFSGVLTVQTTGAGQSNGNSVAEMLYSIQDSNSLLTDTPQLIIIQNGPALNYTLNTGQSSSANKSGSNTSNAIYTSSAILSEFTGTGNIGLSAAAVAQTLIANSGATTIASQVSSADLSVSLTYTYTPPVPEPSGLALFAIATAGLLLWARRRKSSP